MGANRQSALGEVMRMPPRPRDPVQHAERHVGVRLAQMHAAAVVADEDVPMSARDRVARARGKARHFAFIQRALMRFIAAGAAVRAFIELGWILSWEHKNLW